MFDNFSYFTISKDIFPIVSEHYLTIGNEYQSVAHVLKQLGIEDNKNIYLPKFLSRTYFFREYLADVLLNNNIEYKKPSLTIYSNQYDDCLECKYKPYSWQEEIIDEIVDKFNKYGAVNGIIHLKTGMGKTFISLFIANLLKLKTLVIVDDNIQLQQWVERIKEYFPSVRYVGIIKSGFMKDVIGARFSVSLVQTLNSKIRNRDFSFLMKLKKMKFGMVIFDECHKLSASEKYSKVSSIFDTPNVIGLSATPYKYAIQKIQLQSSIGDIIVSRSNINYVPKIYFIEFESSIPDKKIRALSYIGDIIKQRTRYISYLTHDSKYIDEIVRITKTLHSLGHKVLVIATTIELCNKIYEGVKNIAPTVLLHSKSEHEFNDTVKSSIVVGTYKKCSHGFDKKDLSAVIFASPYTGKISIPQIVGRIMRYEEGKPNPVIVYLIDKKFRVTYNINKILSILRNEYNNVEAWYVNINGVRVRL